MLRVGYVNVHGLDNATWNSNLVAPDKLDLLFVAETWYVRYDKYKRAPDTIAYTPRPNIRARSRYTDGICLLGSQAARLHISGSPAVTPSTITCTLGGSTIAAVCMQPAMPDATLRAALGHVRTADVIMGDINV
ncbi:hypothetical protein LTR81_027973 [Elasticomyces elasticus]